MKYLFPVLAVMLAHPAYAEKDLWPALDIATEDGSSTAEIHGTIQSDAGTGSGGGDVFFRRARLSVSGKLWTDGYYKFENDFAADNVDHGVTDAYVGYDFTKHFYLQGGQYKQPFNLENLGSNRFITFGERSSLTAFTPGRRTGIMAGTVHNQGHRLWNGMLSYSDGGIGTSRREDDTRDITARVVVAHRPDPAQVLHAGVAASYRTPDNPTDQITYNTAPENRFYGGDAVDTGAITATRYAMQWGAEAAGMWGPFALQGELMRVHVDREAGNPDSQFHGFYAEASYFLTGEHRTYLARRGVFDRAVPNASVAEGGWGAWQIAARYSTIDLTDGAIHGGEMQNMTLGVNWIPHKQVRMTGDIVQVNTDSSGPAPDADPTLFMLRLQYDF